MPRRDRRISPAEKWLYRRVPAAQRLVRAGLHASRETLVVGFVRQPRLLRAAQRIAHRHLARAVPDPELRARLTPEYVLGCKRVLLSNDFYPALTQPNAELVASGLARVDGQTLIAQDGTPQERSAMVWPPGFRVAEDAGGQPDLRERRGDAGRGVAARDVRAARHRGAGFPEPVPGHRAEHRPRPQFADPHDRGSAQLHPGLPGRAGPDRRGRPRHPAGSTAALGRGHHPADGVLGLDHCGCTSWYLAADGRNPTLWPGSVRGFRQATRRVSLDEYQLIPARSDAAQDSP